jgi:hypothetical protein
MQQDENQNQTQSDPANPEALDEFEKSIRFLSELPTERAMKDLAKMRAPESVRRVVETMALAKMDLVKSLRLMNIRERALTRTIELHRVNNLADKTMADFMALNPDFEVIIKEK